MPISRSSASTSITGEGLAAALAGVDRDRRRHPRPPTRNRHHSSRLPRNLQEPGRRGASSASSSSRSSASTTSRRLQRREEGPGATAAMSLPPIPARILRAAQFHEFVPQIVDWAGRENDVATCRRCARSWSPPAASPRRSSTSRRTDSTPRWTGRGSRRSPSRAPRPSRRRRAARRPPRRAPADQGGEPGRSRRTSTSRRAPPGARRRLPARPRRPARERVPDVSAPEQLPRFTRAPPDDHDVGARARPARGLAGPTARRAESGSRPLDISCRLP